VSNHYDGHAQLLLEALHQLQYLCLYGHIQSGGGFVRNEYIRFAGQRHGYHDTLAHTAGQLVGVLLEALFGFVYADQLQHLKGLFHGLVLAALCVQQYRLGYLAAYGENGVEAGHGILEDYGAALAPEILHLGFAPAGYILAFIEYLAAGYTAVVGQYLHDGVGGDALAGAGFAHYAQHLSGVQVEGYAVYRLHLAVVGGKGGVQVFYAKKMCSIFAHVYHLFSLGSKASLRPSPRRFMERTIRQMVSAGNTSL